MVGDDIRRGDMGYLAGIDEILDGLGALVRRHPRRGLDAPYALQGVVGYIVHGYCLSFANKQVYSLGESTSTSKCIRLHLWLM